MKFTPLASNGGRTNLILSADSYKTTQWMQYPEGYTNVFSYIESRGGLYEESMFFGIQLFVKKYLETAITMVQVEQAKLLIDAHIGPNVFNYEGWKRIVDEFDGYLPVRIRSIKEGSVIPVKNALLTIENTVEGFGWLTSYLETAMLRDVWYGTTVATISYRCKQRIYKSLERTSDNPLENLPFALHDFGYRGVSSDESAQAGGLAHLLNFQGTDTLAALVAAIEYYNAIGPVGLSVIASEHSTMCANADPVTKNDFASAERMVSILEERQRTMGGFNIVSAVADTYDVFRFTQQFIGTDLKDRIVASGGRLVIRPDSGDPEEIPITIIRMLMDAFGYTVNGRDMKVLPPCVRVLQGDGINEESIGRILANVEAAGFSTENIFFGMGGALLQHCDRDWMKFAMKASAIKINGNWQDVFKDPITDPGKTSKKGRISTVYDPSIKKGNKVVTKRLEDIKDTDVDLMEIIYEPGFQIDKNFDELREQSGKSFERWLQIKESRA